MRGGDGNRTVPQIPARELAISSHFTEQETSTPRTQEKKQRRTLVIKTLPEHSPLLRLGPLAAVQRHMWEVCKGPGCRKLFTFTDPVKAWTNTSPGSIETLTALYDDLYHRMKATVAARRLHVLLQRLSNWHVFLGHRSKYNLPSLNLDLTSRSSKDPGVVLLPDTPSISAKFWVNSMAWQSEDPRTKNKVRAFDQCSQHSPRGCCSCAVAPH